MAAATLVMFWSDCNTFGQMQYPFLRIEVGVGFSRRVHRVFAHFS